MKESQRALCGIGGACGAVGGELGGGGDGSEVAAGEHVLKERNYFAVDEAVGGKRLAAVELVRIAGKVADAAAGFFDEKNAGRRIPGVEIELPESFHTAACGPGQIESG